MSFFSGFSLTKELKLHLLPLLHWQAGSILAELPGKSYSAMHARMNSPSNSLLIQATVQR